ncbi:glycoside hydrolase family 43 protein [Pseudoduganella plicata]|uniref:Endo-1,4-beta-xylanase n=1 Tax=Pseudoduganella plicata TaxID=321984 RepID=A0A4P7BDL2_9BURK|nr:glycoside hydrolase family 43 protein [Pseudoduganella plicata]QBQ35379.1 glycoside hydrolase [Pseudoduganella plicata]GGZ01254.1 endo-1,4-beta-xylanase [Pseudoduganella plicata]
MARNYLNPVYPHTMADPFVLRHDGLYYAYGTAPVGADGRAFPVLRSRDLVAWEPLGHALVPPGGHDFWAPEVAARDGKFYMYYSAQGIDDADHQLRVAVSEHPGGPFLDAGVVLVPDQPFSIDAHPFRDGDGQWYLYYCIDFLELEDDHRVGTGIVVDRLLDMTTLAGEPRVVVRPHEDWHLFLKNRAMYGAVYDWHTVEGPAMQCHDGRYYCFYSGGAWERENYGVSYVVADNPLGPFSRPAGGGRALLMSTRPGRLIGPGHNSFTCSPDGKETWIVYHAWQPDMGGRRMCIDQLHWENVRPVTDGPTWMERPAPSGG